jgi:vanillate O-demethylase ferredoxin subunit
MAKWLLQRGMSFQLHYCARSEEAMAYRTDVESLPSDKVHCYFDGGDPRRGVDLEQLLGQRLSGDAVYVCGPQPLIAAVIDTCSRLSWPKAAVHFEYFAAAISDEQDTEFEIVLHRSGRTVRVPAGKTILDVLFEAGESPLHGCKTGDCGLCETAVIEGVPLHRDRVLSDGEKQSGRVMCICVSRARSPQLVLDL